MIEDDDRYAAPEEIIRRERERESIAELIEASSLGAPDVKAMSEQTPPEVARHIVARADLSGLLREMRATARLAQMQVRDGHLHSAYGQVLRLGDLQTRAAMAMGAARATSSKGE